MTTSSLQTPLYDAHVELGGRMVDFAGWGMPIQYSTIMEEHHATRKAVGVFDVSHMGRFHFTGPDAGKFLDSLTSRKVHPMPVGRIRYSVMTNESGGILDDILVYHLQKEDAAPFYAMVVNASNREKIASWINDHLNDEFDVEFTDHTLETCMIAVQGPKALEAVQPHIPITLTDLKNYAGAITTFDNQKALITRTGYTGEDGCEIIANKEFAVSIWNKVMEVVKPVGGLPAGLGARDTLRLEAAMPLYGHELSETINPVEAGLDFAINLKDRTFVGSDAIAKSKNNDSLPVRVGIQLSGRRPAREGCKVIVDRQVVGEVTSGTFSPTLEKPIAMAYVQREHATEGLEVDIDIRGKTQPGVIVALPFYKRS